MKWLIKFKIAFSHFCFNAFQILNGDDIYNITIIHNKYVINMIKLVNWMKLFNDMESKQKTSQCCSNINLKPYSL